MKNDEDCAHRTGNSRASCAVDGTPGPGVRPALTASSRILLVNTFRHRGGAALAAERLFSALLAEGGNVRFLALHDQNRLAPKLAGSPAPALGAVSLRLLRAFQNRVGLALRPKGVDAFDHGPAVSQAAVRTAIPDCDIVNLHWISGFIDAATIAWIAANRAPVVWTLHDMAAFTGGCHYDDGCAAFLTGCGRCPQLPAGFMPGRTHRAFQRKRTAYGSIPDGRLHIVTPSRWLAELCRRSPLLSDRPVTVIPNSVDLEIFRPVEKARARSALGLPVDRPIVLFPAADLNSRRKGGHLLREIQAKIHAARQDALLVLVGGGQRSSAPPDCLCLGPVNDSRQMALAYAAADVVILPSTQDNLPNAILEALACQTPVAAFDAGGIPEFVRPGETGALARTGRPDELASAVVDLLENDDTRQALGHRGRQLVTAECSPAVQAMRYGQLFAGIRRDLEPRSP